MKTEKEGHLCYHDNKNFKTVSFWFHFQQFRKTEMKDDSSEHIFWRKKIEMSFD